jgi:hypothetical protein
MQPAARTDTVGAASAATVTDFAHAVACFDAARARAGASLVERSLQIAGRAVTLRVAGAALADDLTAPFAHLLQAAGAAAPPTRGQPITIDAWHEAETGVAPDARDRPPLPTPYGVMISSSDGRFVAEHREHGVVWLDRQARRIVAWVSSLDRRHLDERARPFHRALAIALGDEDVQLVHAAMVAHGEKGAILVGKGGSGKSTTSLVCLLGGLGFLGDDMVALEPLETQGQLGHCVFASAAIGLHHTERYPLLAAAARRGHHDYEEKSLVCIADLESGRVAPRAKLHAILLPRITGLRDTTHRRASTREALVALAPSSLLQLGGGARAFERMSRVVTAVPSFWLELGVDLDQIAPAIRDLLASA